MELTNRSQLKQTLLGLILILCELGSKLNADDPWIKYGMGKRMDNKTI